MLPVMFVTADNTTTTTVNFLAITFIGIDSIDGTFVKFIIIVVVAVVVLIVGTCCSLFVIVVFVGKIQLHFLVRP